MVLIAFGCVNCLLIEATASEDDATVLGLSQGRVGAHHGLGHAAGVLGLFKKIHNMMLNNVLQYEFRPWKRFRRGRCQEVT
jgi:hypothetical protein